MCRHNSPQQLRFQPDYLRVTTDVIHKTGECAIGFSTNKPYCTHHKSTWFVPQTRIHARQGNVSWIFSYCLISLFGKRTVTVALFANYRIHLMLFYNLLLSGHNRRPNTSPCLRLFHPAVLQSLWNHALLPTWYHKKV